MKFTLLTHSKEIGKPSNTGKLALETLGADAEMICWDRLNPPAKLLEEINGGGVALLYPGRSDEPESDLSSIKHIILIDATWHEARRIHQRSPYLHEIPRISLKPEEKSIYNLRKNQKESGLCTAECVIEILRKCGDNDAADNLYSRLLNHIRPAGKMRGAYPRLFKAADDQMLHQGESSGRET